ncbi:hypothetical protein GGR58DRAFT_508820 [Xylaria digitata]|nr:hypothetical protein GGR58DRAFT_508820 [Xylaria digitata]
MTFELTAVDLADAADLVKQVDFPAMRDGPLYRLMFPDPSTLPGDQREAILQWYIAGLEEALMKEKQNFRQIRTQEGIPVGFCGWTLYGPHPSEARPVPPQLPRPQNPLPETLNFQAWHRASTDLRAERERALAGLRSGLGSLLLQCLCGEFDRSQRFAYVLAAPAGVQLYTKFGFQTVGVVSTLGGPIMSMLRQPRGAQDTASPAITLSKVVDPKP